MLHVSCCYRGVRDRRRSGRARSSLSAAVAHPGAAAACSGLPWRAFSCAVRRSRLRWRRAARAFLGRPQPVALRVRQPHRRVRSSSSTRPRRRRASRRSRSCGGCASARGRLAQRRTDAAAGTPRPPALAAVAGARARAAGTCLVGDPLQPAQAAPVAPDALRAACVCAGSTGGAAAAAHGRCGSGTAPAARLRARRSAGDRIDWKATARARRTLVTREFSEDQHLDVLVAIDAGRLSRVRAGGLDRLGDVRQRWPRAWRKSSRTTMTASAWWSMPTGRWRAVRPARGLPAVDAPAAHARGA